jgi:hypothetical protein
MLRAALANPQRWREGAILCVRANERDTERPFQRRDPLDPKREPTRVTRLFAAIFGLAVAAAALYLLVSNGQSPPAASTSPSAEIDDASREKLERVLEEAETEGED